MKEEYIFRDVDGYYVSDDGYYIYDNYKSALHSLRKKYEEKEIEESAKEKAQKLLDQLNKDKAVRAEFDKLLRKEKLKQLEQC